MKLKERELFTKKISVLVLALFVVLQACNKDKHHQEPGPGPGPDPQNPPAKSKPEIISINPAHGMPGAEITIKGVHFSSTKLQNEVLFNGSVLGAEITAAATEELKVKVPATAVTGKIIVRVENLADTSDTDFIVDPEQLSVTDFTPKQGPFGTEVTLTGKKFGNDIKVLINGIAAKVSLHSSTRIIFTIPVNTTLTSHKITVISDGTTLQTTDNFTVTAAGPYASWENKNIRLTNGASAFQGGQSFVYKNKIYWGFTQLSTSQNQADYVVFDPAQSAKGWILQSPPPADMAPENLKFPAALVYNDRVFIGTGLTNANRTGWWEFFPETNTATRLTDYPEAVSNAVSFIMNNKIYVGFGLSNTSNKNLYSFDPSGNGNKGSWNLEATATFSSLYGGNAFVFGNEAFLGRALPEVNRSRNAMYRYTAGGQLTRVADMPDEGQLLNTPAFTIGNKGYFVISRNVWEYTPDAAGGTWRAVISRDDSPNIIQVAVVTVSGSQKVYGWTSSGLLHEFRFN